MPGEPRTQHSKYLPRTLGVSNIRELVAPLCLPNSLLVLIFSQRTLLRPTLDFICSVDSTVDQTEYDHALVASLFHRRH